MNTVILQFRKNRTRQILLALVILMIVFSLPDYQPVLPEEITVIYTGQSFYGHIKVIDRGDIRVLLVDDSVQGSIDKGFKGTCCVPDQQEAMAFWGNPKNVLIIGLGVGLMPRRLEKYGLNVHTVEIDPKIVEVARKYFNFQGNVDVQDGRYFLKNTNKKYDIILMDAFSGNITAPHLLSLEMFQITKKRIVEGGILAIHIRDRVNSELIKALFTTLKQVFAQVYVFDGNKTKHGSILLVSSERDMDKQSILENINNSAQNDFWKRAFIRVFEKELTEIKQGKIILTDDSNPAEVLQIQAAAAERELFLDYLGKEIYLIK